MVAWAEEAGTASHVATAAIKNFFTETHEDGAKVVNASELLSIKQDTIGACCTGPGPV